MIEVGIDVPNATTIMILGAERFGLSQLHQFRGRVGRGEHQSYCIVVSDIENEVTEQRLSALEQIRTTASGWPKSTSSCAGRASSSAGAKAERRI